MYVLASLFELMVKGNGKLRSPKPFGGVDSHILGYETLKVDIQSLVLLGSLQVFLGNCEFLALVKALEVSAILRVGDVELRDITVQAILVFVFVDQLDRWDPSGLTEFQTGKAG
jgi:hypothetical protein